MAAITSSFYFVATAYGKEMIRDIPVFAFTPGESYAQGWESNFVRDKQGFKQLADAVAGSRLLNIAVPQSIASKYFGTGQQYEKIVIEAYNQFGEGFYMTGQAITTVAKNVRVTNMKPILGWKGLAAPHENQRNHLDQTIYRWWGPVAIPLFVKDADADIVN